MPFVAGKSTGKTHSLSGNLQLLLASLKSTCPLLHQAYLRHAKDASPLQIQALFEHELDAAIAKATARVDRLLRYRLRASPPECHGNAVGPGNTRRRLPGATGAGARRQRPWSKWRRPMGSWSGCGSSAATSPPPPSKDPPFSLHFT